MERTSNQALLAIREFAEQAHKGQRRKYTPEPYIIHPLRVMRTCSQYTDDNSILAAALLHDVLEDTPVTEQELLHFLNTVLPPVYAMKTLAYVIELTDVYTKTKYPQWNRRIRKERELQRLERTSAASQTIKYADMLDNALEIAVYDKAFGKVLLTEYAAILRLLDKGDQKLYVRTKQLMNSQLEEVYHESTGKLRNT